MDYVSKVFLVFEEEGRECVILEDLRDLGYHVLDRSKTLDLEHVLLVLKTLGKHHALSIAMKKKVSNVFEEKAKHLNSVWNHFTAAMDNIQIFQPPIKIVSETLKKRGKKNWLIKLRRRLKTIYHLFYKLKLHWKIVW
ncbi:hypothetical protein WA026_005414 [Henosepilachna vigintioctopunctata]|uniref:Uncharacterized protein n=1 Tax=Henosepilachna vigintioctopunctata TaxID=420089 RepID=A0AAW1U216_9CUCU